MTTSMSSWRGVGSETTDTPQSSEAALLRKRSRKLFASLVRPYWIQVIVATTLIVINTAADLAVPLLIGIGIDRGIRPFIGSHHVPHALIATLEVVTIAVVIEAATNFGYLWIVGRATQDVLLDLRTRVFDHFQKLSFAFFERYTSGRVIARLTSDIDAITDLLSTGLDDLVSNLLVLVGIAAVMLWLDLPLGLAALSVFPIVVILTRWFRKRAYRVYRTIRRTVALVIIHFVESLGGIRAVQAFRREPRNQQIMNELNADYSDANVESIRLLSIFSPGLQALGRVATAIVLVYGGARVLHGSLQIGVLISFVLYVRRFFDPLQELSQVYNLLQAAESALSNLSGVLDEEPDVAEPSTPSKKTRFSGKISLEQIRFSYLDVEVLHDVSIEIPAGQVIALVGETGAGKTTLGRLIARFWDPTQGRVLLDGVDLRDIANTDLRRAIAVVTQESFLFSGSVADNIAFGRSGATREEIIAAATAIGAHEFISALPEGYDSDVQKRGGRLSAGQKQLVSFARAFLADPAVLILDEATSSLDIPSERLVQRALRTLLADRTAIIIAHRLSTVEIADRVLVIDGGRVVEDGSPAKLLDEAGRYAALHSAWRESLK
ncbi:MAG: ABC transporter ATP-binding protein [Actinomycetota bacterium]